MKFYNREDELGLLEKVRLAALERSQMSVIVGRRRIGKTRLIRESLEKHKYLYFFVAKKDERLLCQEFIVEIEKKLNITVYGQIVTFRELFAYLMDLSTKVKFSLVIDEFQEFYNINPSVYSDMQNIWDTYRDGTCMNLILCGSVYTLMKKIFENSKEPLFGRADQVLTLKSFNPKVLKEIFRDHVKTFNNKDLLAFYTITGGVAKYVELLTDKKAFTINKILDEVLNENSLFINEGKNILIEEFGKEYTTYFSILSLIASSKTSRSEIESILERNIGGYLDRLENEYSIIKKHRPIFAKPASRIQKYYIDDNFLNFWFRFVYKYRSAVEIGNFEYLKEIVKRDFDTFSGRLLEKYFKQDLACEKEYSAIGSYWERGNQNEIDIVAVNDAKKEALICEVKLSSQKIGMKELKAKADKLATTLKGFKIEYRGLSLDDM